MKPRKALEQVALKNGVSVVQVRREIQQALDIGWSSQDPEVQRHWKRIPCRGKKPTVEEVLDFMGKITEIS